MNKALLSLIVAPLFILSASYVQADDAIEPSAEMVKEYTEMCVNWAKDDDVSNEALYAYVLKCVNDELESEGYKTVATIKI